MATQETTHAGNGSALFASIAFAVVGLLLLVGGGTLFLSPLSFAGYGIWIFVWGLAFLVGALSRLCERRG